MRNKLVLLLEGFKRIALEVANQQNNVILNNEDRSSMVTLSVSDCVDLILANEQRQQLIDEDDDNNIRLQGSSQQQQLCAICTDGSVHLFATSAACVERGMDFLQLLFFVMSVESLIIMAQKVEVFRRHNGKSEILIDWDRTITHAYHPRTGRRVPSSYGVVETYHKISPLTQNLMNARHAYYVAKEFNHSLSDKIKGRMILDWSVQNNQCMIDENVITLNALRDALRQADWVNGVREGVLDFLRSTKNNVTVFSAGLKTVIKLFLDEEGIQNDDNHIRIFGNEMMFDRENVAVDHQNFPQHPFRDNVPYAHHKNDYGLLCDFKQPLLLPHTKCNHEEALNTWSDMKEDTCVFAIGDSAHDIGMLDAVKLKKGTFGIGIMNIVKTNENTIVGIKKYIQTFDIVITKDCAFFPISNLINFISTGKITTSD